MLYLRGGPSQYLKTCNQVDTQETARSIAQDRDPFSIMGSSTSGTPPLKSPTTGAATTTAANQLRDQPIDQEKELIEIQNQHPQACNGIIEGDSPLTPSSRSSDSFDVLNEEQEGDLAGALERRHHREAKSKRDEEALAAVAVCMDDIGMHEDLRMIGAMGLKAKEARESRGQRLSRDRDEDLIVLDDDDEIKL